MSYSSYLHNIGYGHKNTKNQGWNLTGFTECLLFTSLCAFIYMIYVIIKAILFGDPVSGFPTLLSVILFLGGIQLLALGIIGEYIGRIFHETKGRPVYIVREYNGL